MSTLTRRVLKVVKSGCLQDQPMVGDIINFVTNDIPDSSNIEDFLTHLGDLISIAERSKRGSVDIDGERIKKEEFLLVHKLLLNQISNIVRWGYKEATVDQNGNEVESESIGTKGNSIVTIDGHLEFVEAIFGSVRAGLDVVRTPVEFFTTNYDTLLEDALALNRINYVDGFSGGGVGFWSREYYSHSGSTRAVVTKLHGSIDWQRRGGEENYLYRVRDGDRYPNDGGLVMIYPQATKYLIAQRDPFVGLFQRFRRRLESSVDQVLLICGYSFGDEHINAEIEAALRTPRSQLTVLAFVDEPEGKFRRH